MMFTRRKLIAAFGGTAVVSKQWVKPIISSTVLPVHAATSICSVVDLAGRWRFTQSTHLVPAYSPFVDLFADGSTSDPASVWGITAGEFWLFQDARDHRFRATVTSDCSRLNGTSTTAFTFPPFNLPENGTWSAVKN